MSIGTLPSVIPGLRTSRLGVSALLFESTDALNHGVQERIWALGEIAATWKGIEETVPGMNNLMLVLDPMVISSEEVQHTVAEAWVDLSPSTLNPRHIELPVVYGGEFGPDLSEVAAHAGLSVDDVVGIHSAATYTVYFLGAHPGFAYLGGLDKRIHTPRRAEPRLRVPSGSVAIGGEQAGAIAQTSPSGWQLIGHTDRVFFDPLAAAPALLAPGDQVRFKAIKVLA